MHLSRYPNVRLLSKFACKLHSTPRLQSSGSIETWRTPTNQSSGKLCNYEPIGVHWESPYEAHTVEKLIHMICCGLQNTDSTDSMDAFKTSSTMSVCFGYSFGYYCQQASPVFKLVNTVASSVVGWTYSYYLDKHVFMILNFLWKYLDICATTDLLSIYQVLKTLLLLMSYYCKLKEELLMKV